MSLIIVAGFPKQIQDLYELNLTAFVGGEVICKNNYKELKELLDVLPKVDLIICDSKDNKASLISHLDKYLNNKSRNIPLILIGDRPILHKSFVHLGPSIDLRAVLKNAAGILGVDPESMIKLVVPEYYPVPISYFHCLAKIDYNIYSKDVVDGSYEILFESGSTVDISKIMPLENGGIQHLFVQKKERLKLVSTVTSAMINILSNDDLPIGDRMSTTDTALNIVKDRINVEINGLSEDTINMSNAAIKSLASIVESEPRLQALLDNLCRNRSSFTYQHCQIITLLGYHAIENMSWGTKEQKEKIAFVAFFHDITLVTDTLVRIESEGQIHKEDLSAADITRVLKHALKAAKIVSEFPHAPIGAETIIKQHHGRRDGLGFPRHFGDSISPLAIIFIVCEAFTHELLNSNSDKPTCEEIIKKISDKFTSEKYTNVVDALRSLVF